MQASLSRPFTEEPPPFLGSWPRVYIAVLSYLAILILALYIVTRIFTY